MPNTIEIETWVRNYIANLLNISFDDVNPTVTFDRLGLDSSTAVALVGDLEDWLGIEVDPTLPYDYPSVRELSNHLARVHV